MRSTGFSNIKMPTDFGQFVPDFFLVEGVMGVFFNVGPPKEGIFLTSIHGLYFTHI